jgi:Tfp pilus assembly protein PilN
MIRVNLAPTGARSHGRSSLQVPSFNLGIVFLVLYVAAAGVVGSYWLALSREQGRLAAEVERGTRELDGLRAITGQTARVKAQAAELRQRLATIQDLTRNQGRPIFLLDAFADAMPPDVWITGLEEKATVLRVTGSAFSTTAVSDFMSNLRRSRRFREVDIVIARQDPGKRPSLVTFEVTCRFEG